MFKSAIVLLTLLLTACAPQYIEPESGRVAAKLEAQHFVSFDGTGLPLRSWQPQAGSRGVIIALHGFNDYSRFISAAADYFSANNITVYAYDQRGFGKAPHRGRWPGSDALAEDLQHFVQLIKARHRGTPVYLLGESMGAAVVLHTLANFPVAVDGVILSAPAVWGWDFMPWWQRWGLRLAAFTMPWNAFTGQSLGIVASDNREMLIALGSDPLVIKETRVDAIYGLVNLMQAGFEAVDQLNVPTLVLYGEHDQVIPKEAVVANFGPLVRKHKDYSLHLYQHGYHMLLRDLQASVVWSDIVSWLADHDAALPSGKQGLSMQYRSDSP